jgi:hypothetical protein
MRRLVLPLVLLLAAVAAADDRSELAALFPDEADVFVTGGGGLARLELPLPVLRACEPDRSDLRLFDRDGREVPFLVDDAPRAARTFREERRVPAVVRDVRREVVEREHAPDIHREAFDVAVPPEKDAVGSVGTWALELDAAAREFVRQVTVRTLGGESVSTVVTGSVFRLADGREKRLLPLPALETDLLTIQLEGEDGRFLGPSLAFVASRDVEPLPQAGVGIPVESMQSDGGTTVVNARLSGIAPAALRVDTSTPLFDRRVRVFELDARDQRRPIGSGRIFRVGNGAEQLDVDLERPTGGRLVIEIDDQDSPPLADVVLSVLARLPSLVFELPAAPEGTAAGTLRFGGGRARAARYDLAALMHEPAGETPAALAEALATLALRHDLERAWLGPVRPNPLYDRTPALAFAMHPGAPLDASSYHHRRPLRVRPSPDGLARLRLDPADVVQARPDLGDVRVADAGGRQWAYLLEHDAGKAAVPLALAPPSRDGSTSTHPLALPAPGAVLDGVVLDVEGAFFDRPYRLVAERGTEGERTLTQGRLTRGAGRAASIAVGFPAERVTALALEVDDGDDAPLVIGGAEGRSPVPDLFVAAPAGDYELLVGNDAAESPRYDLARVRDVVLALDAAAVDAGPLEPNPGYRAPSPLSEGPKRTTVILWVVLGIAVVVLLVTTLRLAGGQRTGAA